MGCDIHIITEIRSGDKWQYVPEIPETLDRRNYSVFAVLADVRNSFGVNGFQPKGLPADISGRKFCFESDVEHHHNRYETGTTNALLTPDGKFHEDSFNRDELVQSCRISISKELYDELSNDADLYQKGRYCSLCKSYNGETYQYSVYDASVCSGKWVQAPIKELYSSFEEFQKVWYADDWDEDAQDYGCWRVDFSDDNSDYHSHSYLTLAELQAPSYTDYSAVKYKLDREFYEQFKKAGGVLPPCFTVEERSVVGTIADAFHEALSPTVLVSWQPSNADEISSKPLFVGIKELEDIAKKYNKEPEDIRIVFAFDN